MLQCSSKRAVLQGESSAMIHLWQFDDTLPDEQKKKKHTDPFRVQSDWWLRGSPEQ